MDASFLYIAFGTPLTFKAPVSKLIYVYVFNLTDFPPQDWSLNLDLAKLNSYFFQINVYTEQRSNSTKTMRRSLECGACPIVQNGTNLVL